MSLIACYKPFLLRLLQKLNEVKKAPDNKHELSFDIQMTVLRSIMRIERRITQCKANILERRKLFRRAQNEADKQWNASNQEHIGFIKERIQDYEHICFVLRTIADGLVFIYLDRWDVKPMSFKQSSGYLSGKKGLKSELKALRYIFKTGGVGILNDLTNCLKHGDVTFVVDGLPRLIEIKSSKNRNTRTERQETAMKQVAEYLTTDETTGLYGTNIKMQRYSVGEPEKHHCKAINTVISDAYEDGVCLRRIERGLYYLVYTTDDSVNKLNSVNRALRKIIPTSLIYMLNADKYVPSAYFPFSLSFANPQYVYDFFTGSLVIVVLVDMEYLLRSLKGATGIQDVLMNDEDEDRFLTIKTATYSFQISQHFFDRVPREFISLAWMIREMQYRNTRIAAMASG